MERIGRPFALTLRQAALLGARLSRGELEQSQIDAVFALDESGIPRPLKGVYSLLTVPQIARKVFLELIRQVNLVSICKPEAIGRLEGWLILPEGTSSTVLIDGHRPDKCKIIRDEQGDGPLSAVEVLSRHHTAVYDDGDGRTAFFWQWEPVWNERDLNEQIGGVLEVSGCFANEWASKMPRELLFGIAPE